MNFVLVGVGGAVGAMLRYAISLIPLKTAFPIFTFITNILGATLIGFLAGVCNRYTNISEHTMLLLKTGFCGGFTTFSTFSLEAYDLISKRNYLTAAIYIILSVTCCILGITAGQLIANKI